ncbi:RNA-binding ATPase activator esf2 [Tulasnella sp. JGI-2019a]|nr:RNA-binding ATPase activator esf2 [Tulasnella sp. JGI-2019a]KAG9008639.1 RNA-binding ATPase activator esf2 [Tulasnella sp. JGI-2019a]KAG9033830.1 RNA-binding ATPase activator esf2 [Tulasnella sp. JGI-2019a]
MPKHLKFNEVTGQGEEIEQQPQASSSKATENQNNDNEDALHTTEDREDDPGLDQEPRDKILKPITKEALAAFEAAQKRAGVIYISRIPPNMRPQKIRQIMSQYGEVGRIYCTPEGKQHF